MGPINMILKEKCGKKWELIELGLLKVFGKDSKELYVTGWVKILKNFTSLGGIESKHYDWERLGYGNLSKGKNSLVLNKEPFGQTSPNEDSNLG
jgi:hypothetical protein